MFQAPKAFRDTLKIDQSVFYLDLSTAYRSQFAAYKTNVSSDGLFQAKNPL